MELIKAEARKVCACVYNIALTISETIINYYYTCSRLVLHACLGVVSGVVVLCCIVLLCLLSRELFMYIMLHIIGRNEHTYIRLTVYGEVGEFWIHWGSQMV